MGEALLIEAPRDVRRKPRSPARPKPLYRQLPARGRRGALDAGAVARDQRSRLIGAMIAEASERGYEDATLARLVALAGVSKRAFHEQFGTKEAYFLATCDAIVGDACRRAGAAWRAEEDPRAGLRATFAACLAKLAEDLDAARVVLVEAMGAGPAALERMNRKRRAVERLLGECLREAGDGIAPPPAIVTGIVSGVELAVRRRVLAGEVARLPALADPLAEWTLACGSYSLHAPVRGTAAESRADRRALARCCPPPASGNEWARILRCAAELAAARGRSQLSPGRIAEEAGVSEARFGELFESAEQCFLDAVDRLWLGALVCAARACERGERGPVGVHRGIAALMGHIATDPVLVQVAFVELPALGPAGVERQERLLDQLAAHLVQALAESPGDRRLTAEASAGAIWGIVQHHVARGATCMLPGLANQVSHIALAPAIGREAAAEVISANRSVPGGEGGEREEASEKPFVDPERFED